MKKLTDIKAGDQITVLCTVTLRDETEETREYIRTVDAVTEQEITASFITKMDGSKITRNYSRKDGGEITKLTEKHGKEFIIHIQ
jgi:hypothetical protein